MAAQSVTVRVPATSANMGPGFDVLGMALDIWNRVQVRVSATPSVRVRGEGANELSTGTDNLIYRAAARLFDEISVPIPNLTISCRNTIPLGRGLGSSAAAVVAGLVSANALCGSTVPGTRLLELANDIEGHPDNVAPALLGGCQIVTLANEHLVTSEVPLPSGIRCVIYIPQKPMPTAESRAILGQRVSRKEAIFNLGRVALLVNALGQGRLEELMIATQDMLHQPARQRVFPAIKHVIKAAVKAGALAAFISGGGSSVLAITKGREITVGYEMSDAAHKAGAPGEFKITRPRRIGAQILEVR